MTKRICIGHFGENGQSSTYEEPTISWNCDGCNCKSLDDANDEPTPTTTAAVNAFYNQYINDLEPIKQLSLRCNEEVMKSIGPILSFPQPTSIHDFMEDYHDQMRRLEKLHSNLSNKCLQEVQAHGHS
tara:strand:- start:4956 stop:5339 length:384 start_codon:yes stop_codon:yes gene_type:complete